MKRSAGNWQSSCQQIQISVQAATPIASTSQFIWIGNRIAEERDANNNAVRRFYPQGEQISETSYFYTRDHLGQCVNSPTLLLAPCRVIGALRTGRYK